MPTAVLRLLVPLVAVTLLATGGPSVLSGIASANPGADHLVISEVVTGGATASDELIEIYNPTTAPLPLEGLELVYASASGLTISRRASWEAGAPDLPPGGHLLVANEAGIFASIADATYASGMAATGGSVALRILGAASAIDAVGWGSAASAWLEGTAALAPPPGSSLERLPGGALGSTQDTDDNDADFVVREVPGPENSASPPVPAPSPSGSPQPSPSPTATESPTGVPTPSPTAPPSPSTSLAPSPTPAPTAQPTASPSPGVQVVPIATARALPEGTEVTVEGVALTASDFADGGGYLADDSGGIAVLLSDGSYARGARLRVSGTIDDRYAQRTLRASASDVVAIGPWSEPQPLEVATGAVGEAVEGRLVRIAGTVLGAPTALSAGLAFDVDDGSGPVRLLVATLTGIDTGAWGAGLAIEAIGVVGQRDSSGAGTTGYRVQPRDASDILASGPAPTSTPASSASPTPSETPEPSQAPEVISVAAARQLPKGASATVRGVVTMAPGVVDPTSAVLQDASGAIVLRVGDEAGPVARGTLVELRGVRATLSGMETLRVSTPPIFLGAAGEPGALAVRTGDAGEIHEATLVLVRGALVAAPRRSSAGSMSFEIDDGSGPLRISIGASVGIDSDTLGTGAWIEVRGVLGQETTGSLPLRGYRVWPRDQADLRVMAPAMTQAGIGVGAGGGNDEGSTARSDDAPAALDALEGAAGGSQPVAATLVVGRWEELGVGGLLWDGVRLVALDVDAGALVSRVLGGSEPPVAVRAAGLRVVTLHPTTGIPVAGVPDVPGALAASGLPLAPPLATTDLEGSDARWVSLVGRLRPGSVAPALLVAGESLTVDYRCAGQRMTAGSTASLTGILVGEPLRLLVPCGGIAPAPLLARSTAARAVRPAPGIIRAVAAADSGSSPEPLPAALLLAAATTLLGGAAAARRVARDATPDGHPGAPDAEGEREAVAPPALTLVPMPRERAP